MREFDLTRTADYGDNLASIIERIEQFPNEELKFELCFGPETRITTISWDYLVFKRTSVDWKKTEEHQKFLDLCKEHDLPNTEELRNVKTKRKGDVTTEEGDGCMKLTIPPDKGAIIHLVTTHAGAAEHLKKSKAAMKELKERAGGECDKIAKTANYKKVSDEVCKQFRTELKERLRGASSCIFTDKDKVECKLKCEKDKVSLNDYHFSFSEHQIEDFSRTEQQAALCILLAEKLSELARKQEGVKYVYFDVEADHSVNIRIEHYPPRVRNSPWDE